MLLVIAALFSGILFAGCVQQNAPQNGQTANASTEANTNPSVPAKPNPLAQTQVTLPLVDAVMQDEGFVNDAKAQLQLSDEQIQKLGDAARDDVLKLDETDGDEARSTRAAIKKAEETIKKILGNERGDQFLAFVQERGAGTTPEMMGPPNSVPNDTRIVINSPAFRMDVFENGRIIKSYKVGIGYPEFPLPTGLRKADTIIFSPTWTPPDSPWVKGKFAPGKTVEAGSKDNPLGILKVPIGLPNLIHGGKQPQRLGNFASHGCVGLTNDLVRQFALELAQLGETMLTPEQLKQYEAQKTKTQEVRLTKPVPVELRYETIIVQNGKLIIYRDVYEKGTNTEENLRKVLDAAGVSFDSFSPDDQKKMADAVESMAIDAVGNPVDQLDNKKSGPKSGRVTSNVKGKREIVLEFPQLAGRGYPDPVNLAG
jgi:hypothetical protein